LPGADSGLRSTTRTFPVSCVRWSRTWRCWVQRPCG